MRIVLDNTTAGIAITSFISWKRLQEVFHEVGELKPNEAIREIEVDQTGIKYILK